MAYYAILNENNVVIEVLTGVDENVTQIDTDGTMVGGSSEAWELWYGNLRGKTCKRTSYNGTIRKRYAGRSFTYDAVNDVFISPQPYLSWSLDENFDWQPPTPMPTEGKWYWDEDSLSWVKFNA
jgi:hypothetical protein